MGWSGKAAGIVAAMAAIFIVALASRAAAEPDAARQSAATSGCPRDPRSVALLIADLTGDESSDIRATAAEALGCGGDLRAVEPITAAVAEKDPVIRLAAVDAIARFGEGGRFDGDLPLRLMADRRAAATPGLHDLLARIGAMNGVVDALGHVVTDTAASGQAQNAQADDWSRGDAAWALGRLGNQRAVYYLSLALSDSDDIVRAEAARALIRLGDSRGLPVLARHLADWFYGPRIALVLRREHWTPETDADRIHLWIARRDRARLVRYWSATKTVLLADLKSRFALSALYAAITIGEADFIPDATATLVTGGNRAMAEAFLNCGQPDLKDAAEAWAKARGYAILAGPDAPPVSWGEM